jgi:aquaporin Z
MNETHITRRKKRSPSVEARMVGSKPSPTFLDDSREWRRIFAEWWGTFLLVLAGAGSHFAGAVAGASDVSIAAAIAPALTVMSVIYFMGTVSGAHLNPAVTYAFAIRGNFPWRRVPGYVAAQLVGAISAVLILRMLFGDVASLGATMPDAGINAWQALAIEVLLTAGLVNVILGTAAGARVIGPNGAIAVSGYIAVAGLWAGSLTGASMNLARSLAPDIVRGDYSTSWIYIVGPLLGASIAVGFEWILKGRPTAEGSAAAQGTLEDER